MPFTQFTLSGQTSPVQTVLVLCPDHRSDAMMWLWQEFDGAWSATVTGYRHCDACAHGTNVPAAFHTALSRQLALGPTSVPGCLPSVKPDAARTLSALSH